MTRRPTWVRVVATLAGLIAALAAVITPAVAAVQAQDASCVDLPAVWCAGPP